MNRAFIINQILKRSYPRDRLILAPHALDSYDDLLERFELEEASDNAGEQHEDIPSVFIEALRAAADQDSQAQNIGSGFPLLPLRYAVELWEKPVADLVELFRSLGGANQQVRPAGERVVDFAFWSRMPSWTRDEATALSFGKNPRVINASWFDWEQPSSAFAQDYATRKEVVSRAVKVGELDEPIRPKSFLEWAMLREIDVPTELKAALGAVIDWKACFEDAQNEIARLSGELGSLTHHTDELHGGGRQSILKLLAVMLEVYCKQTNTKDRELAGKLKHRAEVLGLAITDKTIRRWIDEAKRFLPKDDD